MNGRRMKTAAKLIAGIITAAMSFTFVPVMDGGGTILAAGTKSTGNTWLGTSGISNPDAPGSSDSAWSGSYVYFGEYGGSPIRFRVLAKDSTAYNSNKTLFLDSDEILFADCYDNSAPKSNNWADSDIREVLNGSFLLNSFTALEKSAIVTSSGKGKTKYPSSSFEAYVYGSPVSISDKIFLLDAGDVTNEKYGYSSDPGWTSSPSWSTGNMKSHSVANHVKSGPAEVWVLRSTTNDYSDYVGGISGSGNLNSFNVASDQCGIAPALNIYQKLIIFSSLTGNGTNEYKLTLQDKNMTIAVTDKMKVTAEGSKVTVPYSVDGSHAEKASRASILILNKEFEAGNTDNTEILFYGELSGDFDKNSTGYFNLPSSLNMKDWGSEYYVYILAEDANGEKETDYASVPVSLGAPEIIAEPTATPTPVVKKAGWNQEGGKWYYYDTNSNKSTGWVKDGKFWYYCDKDGAMQTGWVDDGGKWYYMSASGAMATGWVKVGTTWYYMSASGAMATGWVKIGTTWYYMNSSGAMVTGWQKIGAKWYYFDNSGAMKTGWLQLGRTWYYMDPVSGAMVTGKVKIDGKMSNFSDSGAWIGYV